MEEQLKKIDQQLIKIISASADVLNSIGIYNENETPVFAFKIVLPLASQIQKLCQAASETIWANKKSLKQHSLERVIIVAQKLLLQLQELKELIGIEKYTPSSRLENGPEFGLGRGLKTAGERIDERSVKGRCDRLDISIKEFQGLLQDVRSSSNRPEILVDADTTKMAESPTYSSISATRVTHYIDRPGLLEAIERAFFSPSDSDDPVVVLGGLGGHGKTQLALEYCRLSKIRSRYRFIWWIDASSRSTLLDGFGSIFELFKNEAVVPQDADAEYRAAWARAILAMVPEDFLLVFDNYDEPRLFDLDSYIIRKSNAHILITTRHMEARKLGTAIEISVMNEAEGSKLIFELAGVRKSSEHDIIVNQTLNALAYLPLTISQAGSYIRNSGLTFDQFLKEYQTKEDQVLEQIAGFRGNMLDKVEARQVLPVFTVWEMSLQEVSNDPSERERIGTFLKICSFMDAAHIGDAIFSAGVSRSVKSDKIENWMNLFVSDDTQALENAKQWDNEKYQSFLAKLSQFSLINSLHTSPKGTSFSIHPLIAEWLRERGDSSGFGDLINESSPNKLTSVINTALDLLNDMRASFDYNTISEDTKRYICRHVDKILLHRAAHKIAWTPEDPDRLNNLFLLYNQSFRLKDALKAIVEECRIRELEPEKHAERMPWVYNNAAHTYKQAKEYTLSLAYYQKALTLGERVWGAHNSNFVFIQGNMASVLMELNKYDEARDEFLKVIAAYEEEKGQDDWLTLDFVTRLARLEFRAGNLIEAEKIFLRSIHGLKKSLDDAHPFTVGAKDDYANLLLETQRYSDALTYAEQVLIARAERYGKGNIITVNAAKKVEKAKDLLSSVRAKE